MIIYLQGKVLSVIDEDRYRLVDVLLSNGVGYQVVVSKNVHVTIGGEVVFHTLFVVREDSQTLYGFKTVEERNLFNMLISVNGIGPKIGISILSFFTAGQLYSVLLSEDFKQLGKVPGLGNKGAQKIVIDLKSKISDIGLLIEDVSTSEHDGILKDLKSALMSLGFPAQSCNEYVQNAKELLKKKEYSVEELIKLVLKS